LQRFIPRLRRCRHPISRRSRSRPCLICLSSPACAPVPAGVLYLFETRGPLSSFKHLHIFLYDGDLISLRTTRRPEAGVAEGEEEIIPACLAAGAAVDSATFFPRLPIHADVGAAAALAATDGAALPGSAPRDAAWEPMVVVAAASAATFLACSAVGTAADGDTNSRAFRWRRARPQPARRPPGPQVGRRRRRCRSRVCRRWHAGSQDPE